MAPNHLASHQIGAFSHRIPLLIILPQVDNRACDGVGVAERNQNTAIFGQQFLGVPIRRRDHSLAAAERIRQRAGTAWAGFR